MPKVHNANIPQNEGPNSPLILKICNETFYILYFYLGYTLLSQECQRCSRIKMQFSKLHFKHPGPRYLRHLSCLRGFRCLRRLRGLRCLRGLRYLRGLRCLGCVRHVRSLRGLNRLRINFFIWKCRPIFLQPMRHVRHLRPNRVPRPLRCPRSLKRIRYLKSLRCLRHLRPLRCLSHLRHLRLLRCLRPLRHLEASETLQKLLAGYV